MSRTLAQAPPPLIKLENCSILLDGKAVLDEANFALRAGERWVIAGPNGSGKTLLLKLLRGDMWPTPTGREKREYYVGGELSEQSFGVRERIAYVGPERQDQYVRYEWNHSVVQVVTTGLFDEEIPRTKPTAPQRRRVTALLKQFGLWSLRNRGFLTLSYGQRRRSLVARAFAGQPQVLLLDEVFNGLDAMSARILRKALHRTRGVGATWIVTTHRAHDMPLNTTHVARMKQGKVALAMAVEKIGSLASAQRDARIAKRTRSASRSADSDRKVKRGRKDALVQLRNVDLYRNYRLVLRDINWTLTRGEHWAIVGRNGSGKSSFLKLLYGDLHPRLGGTIDRDGVPFGTPIALWKQRVGYVSPELQAEYFLARDLTEVVMSGRYASVGLNEAPTAADRRAARRWLKMFGLLPIAHRKPRSVSYGQMRLALLARAMINKPELLLLDEPCTGLDPEIRAQVITHLTRLAKQGVQLVMAVHDTSDMPECVRKVMAIGKDRRVKSERRDL